MHVAASKDSQSGLRQDSKLQQIMAQHSFSTTYDEYDSHSFLLQSNLTAF